MDIFIVKKDVVSIHCLGSTMLNPSHCYYSLSKDYWHCFDADDLFLGVKRKKKKKRIYILNIDLQTQKSEAMHELSAQL